MDEIEYNKKLVGMKRKAESSLLGEQKKLAKVEAELQEERKVRSLSNIYERSYSSKQKALRGHCEDKV